MNFKKVENWDNSLYKSDSIEEVYDITCRINDQTKEVWEKHFNAPGSERFLFPKNCPSFQKR